MNYKLIIYLIFIFFCCSIFLYIYPPFFQDYEIFINYLINKYSVQKLSAPQVVEANFLILDFLVKTQAFFIGITSIYGYYKIFISFGILLFFCFIMYIKKVIFENLINFSILFLTFSYSIFFIQSNIIVTLSFFASVVTLFVFKQKTLKAIFFFLFFFISITSRVDITLILSALFFLISIIYFNKNLIINSAFLLFVSLGLNIYFISLVNKNTNGLASFYKYERAIQDRQDFKGNSDIYSAEIKKDDLKMIAKGMFINDEVVLNEISYSSIIKHPKLIDYIFNNEKFFEIYKSNFESLIEQIFDNALGLFILSCFSWLFILFFHLNRGISIYKFISIIIIYISVPVLINLIANVNTSFIISFMLLPFLASLLIFSINRKYLQVQKIFALFSLVILINHNFYLFNTLYKNKAKKNEIKQEIMKSIKKDNRLGKVSIVSYIDYDQLLPSKFNYNYRDINFIFLDAGAFNSLNLFKKNQIDYFGSNYNSFASKILKVINEDGYIYSTEYTFDFIVKYLKRVHNTDIKYECFEKYGDIDFYKYKVSIIKKPKD